VLYMATLDSRTGSTQKAGVEPATFRVRGGRSSCAGSRSDRCAAAGHPGCPPELPAEIAKDGNPGVRRLSRSQPLVSRDVCLFEYPGGLLDPDVAFVGVGDPHLVRPFDHVCMSGASVRPVEAEPLEPFDELAARDREKPAPTVRARRRGWEAPAGRSRGRL